MSERYGVRKAREQGAEATLSQLGFVKEAAGWDTVKKVVSAPFHFHPPTAPATTWGGTALQVGGQVADMGRHMIFGSPIDDWRRFQQLRQESGSGVKAYGKMLKDYMWAPAYPGEGTLGKWTRRIMGGLGTAATLHEGYRAFTGPESQRAGDVAALGASLVAGPVTGSVGMFAGPVLHNTLTNAARSVGHRLDKPTELPLELPARTNPAGHYGRAMRAANTLRDPTSAEPR